ncbi:glycosyltransferase [Antarctobacter sp.]|uniref:glycosyltransferase n=1 Tax=Antarctobacter sp. TaxID=1872577 RepID=UPI003A94A48A
MTRSGLCILAPDMSPRSGGVYEAISGQARALRSAGRSPQVLSLIAPGQEPGEETSELSIRTIRGNGPLAYSRVPGLAAALDESGAGILHVHGLWLPAISTGARHWQRRTGGALVISPHGMLDPWALRNSRWKKRLALTLYEGKTLAGANCLHALNLSEVQSMRALGLRNPIAVVPNGVDLPPASPAGPPRDADGRRIMLFLGRLHPKKGLAETIRGWAALCAQRPDLRDDWRLVIAGWDDGGHGADLKTLVQELGLGGDVAFPGAVYGAAKQTLLARASAFILASRSEGLPMAVLEAWSHAQPVFMTSECNLPEGFDAGAAIRITTDPAAIAATLVAHLSRADLDQVGRAGRELVEERFTWDSIGRQLDAVYAWLAGDSGARPDWVTVA